MQIQPNLCQRKPQAIIFDFDGVLVESVDVKTEAFRELFKDFPDEMDAFIPYHLEHGGISRFEKIRYFFNEIRKSPINESEVLTWAQRFGDIVVEKVISSQFVKGAEDLLKYCDGRYAMFIVSGTPEEELKLIIRKRKLECFFKAIFGSPEKKTTLVQRILTEYKIDIQKAIFIGDSKTDVEAAKHFQIPFILRINGDNKKFFQNETLLDVVEDMTGVRTVLERLEKVNI